MDTIDTFLDAMFAPYPSTPCVLTKLFTIC